MIEPVIIIYLIKIFMLGGVPNWLYYFIVIFCLKIIAEWSVAHLREEEDSEIQIPSYAEIFRFFLKSEGKEDKKMTDWGVYICLQFKHLWIEALYWSLGIGIISGGIKKKL